MRPKKPTCILCDRPAVVIEAPYEYATSEPVFCTRRCAVAWALIYCQMHGANQWCEKHGRWDGEAYSHCFECSQEESPPER